MTLSLRMLRKRAVVVTFAADKKACCPSNCRMSAQLKTPCQCQRAACVDPLVFSIWSKLRKLRYPEGLVVSQGAGCAVRLPRFGKRCRTQSLDGLLLSPPQRTWTMSLLPVAISGVAGLRRTARSSGKAVRYSPCPRQEALSQLSRLWQWPFGRVREAFSASWPKRLAGNLRAACFGCPDSGLLKRSHA